MASKIMSCNCKNEFQDERYGKGMRVHNECGTSGKNKSTSGWRCTSCGVKKF